MNKKCCTIYKTFKVQNYFSLKDETPLALQANVVYLSESSCDMNQTYIGKTKRQLATRVRDHFSGNTAIVFLYLPATHVITLPLRILSHGNSDFDNNVNRGFVHQETQTSYQ